MLRASAPLFRCHLCCSDLATLRAADRAAFGTLLTEPLKDVRGNSSAGHSSILTTGYIVIQDPVLDNLTRDRGSPIVEVGRKAKMSNGKPIETAAIYARVSTTDQTCDLQLRDLREYCERRGWRAIEYVDTGVSGAKASREQLDRLMLDAKRGKLDVVICWRFDRFARSTKHLLDALEEFKSLGIGFVSHQEAIDTTSPMGKLLFTIVAAMAEMERSILIERVRAGMATAKAKGKSLGCPKRVFRRDIVFQFRAEGLSWRAISKRLGVPVSTLHLGCSEKTIKNEASADCKQNNGKAAV